MTDRLATTIGAIVASDFRTAAILDRYGRDFCGGGRRTFEEACRSASADVREVADAIDALSPASSTRDDPASLSLDRLVDHILSTHHEYVKASMPVIAGHLEKIADAHGSRHPEVTRVAAHFERLRGDLGQHM